MPEIVAQTLHKPSIQIFLLFFAEGLRRFLGQKISPPTFSTFVSIISWKESISGIDLDV